MPTDVGSLTNHISITPSAVPQIQSPAQDASLGIAETCSWLRDDIDRLEVRLASVLRPIADDFADARAEIKPEAVSQHVSDLRKHIENISALRARIDSILARLDV